MLRAAAPDLSLATTLLQGVRAHFTANALLRKLTAPCIVVYDHRDTPLAVQRLTQTNSAYPLRRIEVHCASPQLPPALGAATTLESVRCMRETLSQNFKSQIALQLKAVPSLRDIHLNDFPIEAGLELLQTRKNWEQIGLPERKNDCMKASALATHNKTAFKLESMLSEACEGPALWLANPHLTALRMDMAIHPSVWDQLPLCGNLTNLVRSCALLRAAE
jgi:hypothetical protein